MRGTDAKNPVSARPGYGWAVVAATFVVLFFGFGNAYSFGAFFDRFEGEFAASRASVSLAFGISGFLFFGLGAVFGPLADRFGARWIAVIGMLVIGGGMVAASFSTSLWNVYLSYGLGTGIGVGMIYVPTVGAVQKWFTRRRGLASGFAVAGIGAGTLLMPIVAAWLIETWDWRTAYMTMGIVSALCGVLAASLITAAPDFSALPDVSRPASERPARDQPAQTAGISLGAAIRSRPFALIYVAFFLTSLGNFIPMVHLVPYARDHGISRETAVLLLGLIGVGSTVGRFALGGMADRFGRQRSLAVAFGGLGLSCFWWSVSTDAWQLAVFALWMGICYGGFVALGPAVMADYFGVRNVSGITGVLYSGVGVGTLAGPPLAGLAFDMWQSYTFPILASAVAATLSAVLVFSAQPPTAWHAAEPREEG